MGRKHEKNVEDGASQLPGTSTQKQDNTNESDPEPRPGTSRQQPKSGTRHSTFGSARTPGIRKKKVAQGNQNGQKIGTSNSGARKRSRPQSPTALDKMSKDMKNAKRKKKILGSKGLSWKKSEANSSLNSLQRRKVKRKKRIERESKADALTVRASRKKEKKSENSDNVSNVQRRSKLSTKRKMPDDNDAESSEKRSRTQTSVTMTTRSMRAKKVGVTRFIFDKVCNCSEDVYYTIFTDAGLVKGCPCGKRFEQFMKLTGGFDSVTNKDISSKQKILVERADYFNVLSIEMICYIFQYLTLREVLRFESLSKKLERAVHASLLVREEIDFNEEVNDKRLFEYNLPNLTNHMFARLLSKLPKLRYIYNFHPAHISPYPSMNRDILTVPAVCDAMYLCKSLEGVEISNMDLLEYLVMRTVHPKIIGKFQNRNQQIRESSNRAVLGNTTVLKDGCKITNLHLVGCSVYYMPQMDSHLEHLYLRMVKFVHHHPFKDFSACRLKSFVMSHCIGPTSALKYIPLLTALADARGLKRLELQRVPFLGGVIQHICEDNWQEGGFRRLNSITMGQCKNALDADLGYLIIAAAAHLESLKIQSSLTKDAVFSALAISDVTINPGFEELSLGWREAVPFNESLTNEELIREGLADLPESQSRLTDSGMRLVGQCFPPLKKLEMRSCPHLINPLLWFTSGQHYLRQIRELTLEDCHSMRVEKFCAFLTFLPELRYLTLREIFKEPPLGCSRVGLSAGTGLGISSALINPQPVVNNQGAGNNNDNEENNGNQPAEQGQGNNRAEDDGIENEAANQDEDLTNRNAGAEFENQNGRYNLRHSSRSASCQSVSEQGPAGQASVRNTAENKGRKSTRLSDGAGNTKGDGAGSTKGARNDNNGAVCDSNKSVDTDSSCGSSGTSGDRADSKKGVGSCKGKALVTKKGLVSKVKSSKGNGKENENADDSADTEETTELNNKCTCVKQKADVGCQVSNDDIRKAGNRKNIKRRRSSRKYRGHEKIIEAGRYKPSSVYDRPEPSPACPQHRHRQPSRPAVEDKCDSTNDPVWEEDHSMVLTILHRRLEYLKIDAIGVTELSIVCYNLRTLSVSRCRVLKEIKLKEAPFLENVHVSQCRKFNESLLLDEIYRLPPNKSKFVSLRPLHYVDKSLYQDLVFLDDFSHCNFGTVMVFDYSDTPSKTNYNKLRMKSWIGMLERMTTMTMMDHGWQRFHEMDSPLKFLMDREGRSSDGSQWKMFADIPWIELLEQCPDMEEENMKNPEWKKPGVYSMEAKGHFSFWDAYADIQHYLVSHGPNICGLYECNVLTYINMCDIDGVPTKDALSVL